MTTRMAATATRLLREESGQDLLEYGLLASLIATFVIGALTQVGSTIHTTLWAIIAAAP